nr:class I SAM-dependent methyltransferase [Fusobacterium russii]
MVNLGCGLDQSSNLCDNELCNIVNIDLPEVISIRNQLISPMKNEKNISKDLKDYSWMDEIDASNGAIFFAAGVFYYFKSFEVKNLILKLSEKFPGSCLVFDSVGKLGLKLMLSKMLKNMGIKNIDGFFYLNDPVKDLSFSEKIRVSSKDYMLGYYDMKKDNINFFHRLLAKIGDKFFKMAINKIEFL